MGQDIRVDDGYEEGMEIPIHYDPMISKLITYGKDRDEAIQNMIGAIDNYIIEGVTTTLSFGKYVCRHQAFQSGNFDTHFIEKHYDTEALKAALDQEAKVAGLLALKLYLKDRTILRLPNESQIQ